MELPAEQAALSWAEPKDTAQHHTAAPDTAALDIAALHTAQLRIALLRTAAPARIPLRDTEAVQADEALSALGAQLEFMIPQGQYPGEYWGLAEGLGDDIISGKYADADDAALMAALETFQAACEAAK